MISHEQHRIAAAAERLWQARRERAPIEVLTAHWPELDEAGAYAVARATLALAGERPAGYKLGYTSAAMRAQMGVEQPNYGVLTEAGRIEHDGEVALSELIHPLVEPEIALVLGCDLRTPVGDADTLHGALASVHPALEIVDTRYREYRFSACDNIADNSSAARYVLGPGVAPAALPDLAALGVILIADGTTLERGSGADALGHPLRALAWLANRLIAEGTPLWAGAVVLSGGLTRAACRARRHALQGRLFGARRSPRPFLSGRCPAVVDERPNRSLLHAGSRAEKRSAFRRMHPVIMEVPGCSEPLNSHPMTSARVAGVFVP